MEKMVNDIVALSKIDKEIDDFEPKVDAINAKLDDATANEQALLQTLESLNAQIDELKSKITKNDLYLKDSKAKLDEISKKSSQVKTEKDMKALQVEEEYIKEGINFANDEASRFEGMKEEKESELQELNVEIASFQAQLESIKAEVKSKLEQIDQERAEVFARKDSLLGDMNQKIITFYSKIRRWAKNSAVVPLKKQACMGCFMKINDKTYAKVIKASELITCPHCGRILYIEDEPEA